MKNYTDTQLAKLPKWAQKHIAALTRENAELTDSIKTVLGQVTDDTYSVLLKDGYGYGHTEVRQNIDGHDGIDIKPAGESGPKFSVRVDKYGQLCIMATGYPSSLVVIPQTSNVVNVAVVQKSWDLGADK